MDDSDVRNGFENSVGYAKLLESVEADKTRDSKAGRKFFHDYDGSKRFIHSDLSWPEMRLYWLAALGVASQCRQLSVDVTQRIVACEGLRMPDCYSVAQCSTWRLAVLNDRLEKPGSVDKYARLLVRP